MEGFNWGKRKLGKLAPNNVWEPIMEAFKNSVPKELIGRPWEEV